MTKYFLQVEAIETWTGLSDLTKAKLLLMARKKLFCLSKTSALRTLVPTFVSIQAGVLEGCGGDVVPPLPSIPSSASLPLQPDVPRLEMLHVALCQSPARPCGCQSPASVPRRVKYLTYWGFTAMEVSLMVWKQELVSTKTWACKSSLSIEDVCSHSCCVWLWLQMWTTVEQRGQKGEWHLLPSQGGEAGLSMQPLLWHRHRF